MIEHTTPDSLAYAEKFSDRQSVSPHAELPWPVGQGDVLHCGGNKLGDIRHGRHADVDGTAVGVQFDNVGCCVDDVDEKRARL